MRKIWTYEATLEEAKKYKTIGEFRNKSESAYNAAIKNKWISDFSWLEYKTRPRNYWTEEKCLEEAKKYKTRSELKKNNSAVYQAAMKNGWIKNYSWFTDGNILRAENNKKQIYEAVKKEALKYKTRSEFRKNNLSVYNYALKNNLMKDFTWIIDDKLDLYNDKIDSVYAYEFEELNSVYVGRTLMMNQKLRDYQHIFGNDSVSSFAKLHNIPIPKMKILEDNLTIKEGSEKEENWINKYKKDGWIILNKAKPGSIGSLGSGKWTYNTVKTEALKYKTKSEFKYGSSSAYNKAINKKWIDDFDWFVDGNKIEAEKRRKWTYETVKIEALKYKTKQEWRNNNESSYKVALKNNWLKDFDWLANGHSIPRKWTYETVREEALKYKTKSEFRKNAAQAINLAIKNKWIDDFDWFVDGNKLEAEKRKIWTYDTVKSEASKYKSRWDFGKNNGTAYKVALKNKWLDEFFPK